MKGNNYNGFEGYKVVLFIVIHSFICSFIHSKCHPLYQDLGYMEKDKNRGRQNKVLGFKNLFSIASDQELNKIQYRVEHT